jgi:hypothetical protein
MLNKPLILVLLVSLSFNGLFGYLSYSFYSDKAVAETALDEAKGANKSLQESLDKKDEACLITDAIVSEYQEEKQEIVKEKDKDLNAIDKMMASPVPVENKQKRQENAKEQKGVEDNSVINLDSKLSDDLVRLLSQSCNRSKGSTCTNP